MTPEQSLQILMQLASQAKLNFEENNAVKQALSVLAEAIKPKEIPPDPPSA